MEFKNYIVEIVVHEVEHGKTYEVDRLRAKTEFTVKTIATPENLAKAVKQCYEEFPDCDSCDAREGYDYDMMQDESRD